MLEIGSDLGPVAFQHRSVRFHDIGIALDFCEVTATLGFVAVPTLVELVQLNVLDQHVALIGAPSGVTFVAVAEPLRGSEQALFGFVHPLEVEQRIGDFTIIGCLVLARIFIISVERDAAGRNIQRGFVICDSQFGLTGLVVGKSAPPEAEAARAPIGDGLGRDNLSNMFKCCERGAGKRNALVRAIGTGEHFRPDTLGARCGTP